MDPREKRDDETMAEWGARLAAMGEDVAFGPQGVRGFGYSRPSPLPVLPIGSDYTDEKLRTPIRELREQNVVPIRPFQKVSQAVPAGLNMRVPGQSGFISEVTPYTETPAYTGYKGLSQDYGDFSPSMGMLADMAGDQPIYDQSVVTDMPSRPVVDPRSYSTNMPQWELPADTQLRELDSRQPRTWGPVPSEGIVPIGADTLSPVTREYYGVTDESNVSPTISSTIEQNLNVDAMINKLGNTGMLSGAAQRYGFNHPFEDIWSDHPYLASEDAMFSQGMKQMQDYQDYGILGGMGYTAKQLPDEISKALGLRGTQQPSSLRGLVAQMSSPMVGVQQENIPALVDDIVASRVHGITSANRPNFSTGALADPNISVQATQAEADAEAAKYMAAAADTQDIMMAGGVVGGGVSDFIKDWVGKVDDARTIVTPAGPVTIGADSRGATFTLDVPASRRTGATVDAPPPDLIKAQEQVDMQAMLARSAQRLQDEQAEQARQVQEAAARQQQQQESAQRELRQFYQGRAYQEGGAPVPAHLIGEVLRQQQVDTFSEAGGFDPQGGTTGSSGMGAWT
jgi:hypothetical protein